MVESQKDAKHLDADALVSLFIMLGMRKNNPHQVFVLLDALNDYFKQPQYIEAAASKLFKGDGAAGNKIKEEIESIDTSGMADKALAKLID